MEGIELEAEGCEETVESGLSAFEVSESETRWCTRGDREAGLFLDPLQIRLILICVLLALYA
eukprot:612139-Rhodomonas_salina.1